MFFSLLFHLYIDSSTKRGDMKQRGQADMLLHRTDQTVSVSWCIRATAVCTNPLSLPSNEVV